MKRTFLWTTALFSLVLLASSPSPPTARAGPRTLVQSVASVGFTVSDMDRSLGFYRDVLTFTPVSDVEVDGAEYDRLYGILGVRARIVRMRLGEQQLELTQFLAPPDARPIPVPSHSNDLWFQHMAIVVRDMDEAWSRLRARGVRSMSPRPQTIPSSNPVAGGIRALKFRDPDGHNLELLWFPEGKDRAGWNDRREGLFLGIDHTALTVGNTDGSLRFYRDLLGLSVAGGSLNRGVEQEWLDHIPGAQVRVTGLVPRGGPPGVECLEYERPGEGRSYPADSLPTDLWHWQTTLVVADVEAAAVALRPFVPFISAGVAVLDDRPGEWPKRLLIRDPDGHALQLVSP